MRTSIPWHELGALALGGALLILPACEPKADDDTGSSTSGDSEASSSDGSSSGGSVSDSSGGSDSSTSGGTATATATSGSSSDSSSGVTSDATTGDPPQPCAGDPVAIDGLVTSMAYLKSQIPPDMTTGSGSSGSSSGGEPDPSTLYIRLSDQSFECKDPNAILSCGAHWDLTIVIPPEYQTPGTYALGPGDVLGIFGETGPDEGGNNCGFGGGTFGATLEIIALDDSTVEGRLCNVDSPWLWPDPKPDLEGTFYADRCP